MGGSKKYLKKIFIKNKHDGKIFHKAIIIFWEKFLYTQQQSTKYNVLLIFPSGNLKQTLKWNEMKQC